MGEAEKYVAEDFEGFLVGVEAGEEFIGIVFEEF